MTRLSALILALSASIGCGSRPAPAAFPPAIQNPDPRRQKDEEEIRLVAFHEMLGQARSGETCFIAISEIRFGEWSCPSDEFMARLSLPRLKLRKVSEARFPAEYERDPENPQRYQSIRDPETGKPSYVYWVAIEWLSSDRAKAQAGFTRGPLSGGGSELTIAREAGAWLLKGTGARWAH